MSGDSSPKSSPSQKRSVPEISLHGPSDHVKENLIRGLPFFQQIKGEENTDDFFAELAQAIHLRHYLAGDLIIEEGEVARTVFFIIRGQVEVVTSGGDVVLAELNSGAFFGEMAVLFETPRVATVRATTKCLLAVLAADDLRKKLSKYPVMLDLIQIEAKERFSKLASEMEKNGKRLNVELFEKFHEMKKDTSHVSLKDLGRARSSRKNSDKSFDLSSPSEASSYNSRSSSLLAGVCLSSNTPQSEDSSEDELEADILPSVPAIAINSAPRGANAWEEDSDCKADNEGDGKGGLSVPTSYTQSFSKKQTLRRRASVAVWSDDRLLQLAQSVASKESQMASNAAKVSSALAGTDSDASDEEEEESSNDVADFGILNRDIMAKIVRYLDFRSLWLLRGVGKALSQLLVEREFELTRSVDLSPWHKRVDDNVITAVVTFCGKSIRYLNLRNCWQITDKGLLKVGAQASGLERIVLASVWDVTDGALSTLAQLTTNLRYIDLSNCRKLTDTGVLAILSGAPNLVSIQMSYCKNLSNLSMQHATWASLQAVNMQRCTGISDAGFMEWEKLGRIFELRELVLSDCSFLTDAAVASIACCCPSLEVLSLSFCCALTEAFAGPIVDGCPNIRILDLSFCGTAVTDDILKTLTQRLSRLERLSIRGCVQVTDVGLGYLKSSKSLQVINFSQCRNLQVSASEASALGWSIVATGSLLGDSVERWEGKFPRKSIHERAVTA
ncbi:hypothetical protein HDU67_009023 [Dinochytrium kinnereticum]|nr:hypothetical protein HDU67_009023 [Dinochytrium kinnereticum]